MEDIKLILSIISIAVGLAITTFTFMVKMVKAIKTGNKEKAKNLLTQAVSTAVQFAEQLRSKTNTPLTGESKKAIALNEIKAFCADHKIKFDADAVGEMIEETVSLTKTVNASKGTSNLSIEGAEIK